MAPETEGPFSLEAAGEKLIHRIEPLSSARIIFEGFTLPEEFGEGCELAFGDMATAKSLGLRIEAMQMAKAFVLKTLDELFRGDFGPFVPTETLFTLKQEGETSFFVTALK